MRTEKENIARFLFVRLPLFHFSLLSCLCWVAFADIRCYWGFKISSWLIDGSLWRWHSLAESSKVVGISSLPFNLRRKSLKFHSTFVVLFYHTSHWPQFTIQSYCYLFSLPVTFCSFSVTYLNICYCYRSVCRVSVKPGIDIVNKLL